MDAGPGASGFPGWKATVSLSTVWKLVSERLYPPVVALAMLAPMTSSAWL